MELASLARKIGNAVDQQESHIALILSVFNVHRTLSAQALHRFVPRAIHAWQLPAVAQNVQKILIAPAILHFVQVANVLHVKKIRNVQMGLLG
jgi:hypothetical protein